MMCVCCCLKKIYPSCCAVWEVVMAAQPWKGKMMGEIMTTVMLDGGRLDFGTRAVPQVSPWGCIQHVQEHNECL